MGVWLSYINYISYGLVNKPFFENFARAGGGGSGSSGGGDGIFILLGFLPMQFFGGWCRKRFSRDPNKKTILIVTGWSVAILYSALWLILAGSFFGFGMIVAILFGMASGLYGLLGKLKPSKKLKADLSKAQAQDSAWNEESITSHAKDVFMKFQQDWSNLNAEAMKPYQTAQYQYHNALMIYALQLAGRKNIVSDITILKTILLDIHDDATNNNDTLIVGIEASARDSIVDTTSNKELFKTNDSFEEFWKFQRSGDTWLLDGIQQATEAMWPHNTELENFANSNGYYYSADWGWLLLPQRGQLFNKGRFGTSDINNHVIGLYDSKLLVQIYSYVPVPSKNNNLIIPQNRQVVFGKNLGSPYLIAQAYLPKNYGNIVVRRKKGWSIFSSIRGLKKVSTEWSDFNKKYEVFATSIEQATSLELLNPKYMEKLEAVPFEVNIEVVDNVVYLYSKEKNAVGAQAYETMLSLLQAAFKEMKL